MDFTYYRSDSISSSELESDMFSDSLRLQVPFHVRMDDVPSWDVHTVQNILPFSNSNHGKAVSHRSLNWRAGLHVLVVEQAHPDPLQSAK